MSDKNLMSMNYNQYVATHEMKPYANLILSLFCFRLESLVYHSWLYRYWYWYNWNNVDCLHLLASVRVPRENLNTLFSFCCRMDVKKKQAKLPQ